jgi:uncharacterized protein (DUF2252 family)
VTTRAGNVAQSILDYNRGRDPRLLQRKFALLRQSPFAFFRGTCHLFYEDLPRDAMFAGAPAVLVCGDLHLENFGTYKGDNRLVYFDLNDFDEAALAPCTFELVRFVASLFVAAAHLELSAAQAELLCKTLMAAYRGAIGDGKPRWVEPSTADGMVRDLMQSLEHRTRRDLLDKRTERVKSGRRLRIDDVHAHAIATADRDRIEALLRTVAASASHPHWYRLLDAAQRVAGNGSLGVERYVLLVQGKGSPDNNYLLDLKRAVPSALAPVVASRQPAWSSDAQRVVTTQRIVQAISPALLSVISDGSRSYVLKELQLTADRLDLSLWHGHIERLESVMTTMAEVTAWGHLRGCARHGAASVEELQEFVAGAAWEKPLIAIARECGARTLTQWRAYCAAYDERRRTDVGPTPARFGESAAPQRINSHLGCDTQRIPAVDSDAAGGASHHRSVFDGDGIGQFESGARALSRSGSRADHRRRRR